MFSMLTKEETEHVKSKIIRKSYSKGETVFLEGDNWDKLYIISRGKLKVFKLTKEGKEQILYILSEGEFMGDMNLLKQGRYDFNAAALEDVELCTLNKESFEKLIKAYPTMMIEVLEVMHDRILSLEELIKTLSTKDVEARLAAMLLSFINNFGETTEKGVEIDLPLNREDMANYIGITRETISRKLNNLQDEGVIELIGNKKLIIKKPDILKERS